MGGLLLVLVLATYLPSIGNEFVNYDDGLYVTANIHVQSGFTLDSLRWAFSNYEVGNWHPLTWLSHMLDCQLFGLKSWGHHLISVLFHTANTLLLFLLFDRMTGAKWRSFLVAALFGLHPLHVESVAWASERKDVLSAFFFMLTLLSYVQYASRTCHAEVGRRRITHHALLAPKSVEGGSRNTKHETRNTEHAPHYYALALLPFALGLMSKPMLVTLPFVLLLLDFWPLHRLQLSSKLKTSPPPSISHPPSSILRLVLEKLPFFALSAAAAAVTFFVQNRAGAMESMGGLPLTARLANALVSCCRYLGKLLWPFNLAVFYPHPGHWPATLIVGALLLLLGITILVFLLRRQHPWLGVGWLWFLGTLVPVIGVVQVGIQSMADRYTYLPAIGIFAALVWEAAEWLPGRTGQIRPTRQTSPFAAGLSAAVLLLCAGLAFRQLGFWKNSETLFRHALDVTPENNYIAHNNLGLAFNQQGRYAEAVTEFRLAFAARSFNLRAAQRYAESAKQLQQALKLQPEDADLHQRLGYALIKQSRFEEGTAEYQQAFRLSPHPGDLRAAFGTLLLNCGHFEDAAAQFQQVLNVEPHNPEALNGLGEVLLRQGRLEDAIKSLQQVLTIDPHSARAHANLGIVLSLKGRLDESIPEFQEALRLRPGDAKIHSNLGLALQSQGRLDEAIRELQQSIALKPDDADAHNNLGMAFARKGRVEEANQQFAEALKIKPNDPKAHNNLGLGLSKQGRLDAAIFQFEETLKWTPDSPETHAALGVVLARKGRKEDAINHLRQALKLRPNYPEAERELNALLSEK